MRGAKYILALTLAMCIFASELGKIQVNPGKTDGLRA